MKTFVLDYKKWRSGGPGVKFNSAKVGLGDTVLLNEEGYMCCLGQFCLQSGVTEKDLLNLGTPSALCRLDSKYTEKISKLVEVGDVIPCQNSVLARQAMRINDNYEIQPRARVEKLKALFESHGIEMKVINCPWNSFGN